MRPQELNAVLRKKRKVRATLFKQPNVGKFIKSLLTSHDSAILGADSSGRTLGNFDAENDISGKEESKKVN